MQTTRNQAINQSTLTRFLITCGAVGPLLFIIIFLIEGATRPGYSVWRNYVSSLSLSDQGWMQIANFLICGVLTLCFTIGLCQVFHSGKGSIAAPILLGLFSVGLIIAGLFVTDPGLGYPPGSLLNATKTLHGTIHGVAGLIVFYSLSASTFVLARRFAGDPQWKGWTAYSIITGLLIALLFIVFTITSVLDDKGILPSAPTGLLQRITIIIGWGWIALLALRIRRTIL